MKTAISLPDHVFEKAERFARRLRKSGSQLYAEAPAEYLARHAPDAVTDAMNAVCDRLTEKDDEDSVANVSQIVTLDKRNLTERVGKLPAEKTELILAGIDVVLGR